MSPSSITVEPEAEADLLEAFDWYEKQREGLGAKFIECVDDAFEQITRRPSQYAIAYRNVRQALVRRFPYVVCFLVDAKAISVVGVFHCRRDPRQWQARVE